MPNEIMKTMGNLSAVIAEDNEIVQYHINRNESTDRLVSEVIASVKDDRMNTKRAISADIASTARVQNQNDRLMAAYERELHRRDLSEEERQSIFVRMEKLAESTAVANQESREFQNAQLEYSHSLPWKLLAFGVLMVVVNVGGATLIKKVA